jgi:hypothetical protein
MQPHVVLPTQPETAEVKISDLMQWSTAEYPGNPWDNPGNIREQQEVEVTGSLEREESTADIREQLCVRNRFESPWVHSRSGSKVHPTRIESSPAYLFQTKWRVE